MNDSEVLIATGYFTIPALFELITQLETAKSVRVLVDANVDTDNRFAFMKRNSTNIFSLDAKFKATSVYELVKKKFQSVMVMQGDKSLYLVKNPDKIHCFSLVAQDVNMYYPWLSKQTSLLLF
jgi:hypothetical protein